MRSLSYPPAVPTQGCQSQAVFLPTDSAPHRPGVKSTNASRTKATRVKDLEAKFKDGILAPEPIVTGG